MNKITPRLIRDLHETLPEGTECYLCTAVRNALAKYREGHEPLSFLDKDKALPLLARKLGRGLKRFLRDDIRRALKVKQEDPLEKML